MNGSKAHGDRIACYRLPTLKYGHRRNESIGIVRIISDIDPIDLNHFVHAHRVKVVHCDS